jgi:hypothetical protein
MITMPANVIGIDVDVYRGGGGTLAGLARKHGNLPLTWESSSRDDGSGIGLYLVPAGTRLVGKIDPGIEIIQYHHRYCVCWPSIHPSGQMYRWWLGTASTDTIPKVYELPDLPRAWLKALTDKPKASKGGTPYSGDVGDWLAELPDRRTPASVRKIVRDAERAFGNGSCRHDTMVTATGALVAMGAQGKAVRDAVFELEALFCVAVADNRDGEWEYWSAVEGAIKQWGGAKPRERWRPPPVLTGAQEAELDELGSQVARMLDGAA